MTPALVLMRFGFENAPDYGAIFMAGSLHGPGPAEPIAATRNQYRVPLVMLLTVTLLRVQVQTCAQPPVGSVLRWTS